MKFPSSQELIEENQKLEQERKETEKEMTDLWNELVKNFSKIGNLVHESVPIDDNEDNNKIERTWGTVEKREINGKPGSAHHHEVLGFIGGYDAERGQKVAGHRGYYLKGYGVLLNQALIQYGMRFLFNKGYSPVQPPYFMKREIMAETAQLSDFDDQLYKIEGDTDPYYLIATAEQPISCMYRNEWLEKPELPIKYSGISPCFRKEAGSHGKDTWGIFRVHQFEKVEQFIISAPEDSWALHEEMIKVSEEFYQSLNLPYRVINIVSGALNDAAAKKFDLEAWFPGYDAFRELVSCSNCTDYQSRSINIRLRTDKSKSDEKKFVHMLNGTLCATERTLCCILENYQTETGVRVPEPLIPYVGTDFIPYVKEKLPGYQKEEEKKDKKKKEEKKEEKKDVKKTEKTEKTEKIEKTEEK
jgi:seryl-tRNA synthetase